MRLDVVGWRSDHQISDDKPIGFGYERRRLGNSKHLPTVTDLGLEALLLRTASRTHRSRAGS